jgi:hypothetical protein
VILRLSGRSTRWLLVAVNEILPLIGSRPVPTRLSRSRACCVRLQLSAGYAVAVAVLDRPPCSSCRWLGRIRSLTRCRRWIRNARSWRRYGCSICRSSMSGRTGTASAGNPASRDRLLAIFLCPLLDPRPFPLCSPSPSSGFPLAHLRVMLGAGLIRAASWRNAALLPLRCSHCRIRSLMVPFPAPCRAGGGVLFNHLIAPGSCSGRESRAPLPSDHPSHSSSC